MKKLSLSNQTLSCENSTNVPGHPVAMSNGFLITKNAERNYYWRPWYRHVEFDYYDMGIWRPGYNRDNKTFSLDYDAKSNDAEIVSYINKDLSQSVYDDQLISYSSTNGEHRLDLWSLTSAGDFISRPHYLSYNSNFTSLVTVRSMKNAQLLVIKNDKMVDFYTIDKNRSLKKLSATSTFDPNKSDDSAEYIFSIHDLTIDEANKKIYISQGFYGVEVVDYK